MSPRRKRRREPASLDGVDVKIERARFHARELDASLETRFPDHRYVVAPEIYGGGLRHVYKAKHPPAFDPQWGAMIGDCVHNLRSALDHVAFQLIRMSGREPSIKTQFPILDRPPRTRWKHKLLLPNIAPGARDDKRKVLKVVQPYARKNVDYGLAVLRDLDNRDKHRELVVVAGASECSITSWNEGDIDKPPPFVTEWTGNPLIHNEVIAIVTYERPYPKADKNLFFIPHVAFGDIFGLKRHIVPVVLGSLIWHVEDEVVSEFRHFFP